MWHMEDEKLIGLVCLKLIEIGWIKEKEIIGTSLSRAPYAYPVLETGYEDKSQAVTAFLGGFCNLKLSGRNAKFMYGFIHDMLRSGKDTVEGYLSGVRQ